MERPSRPPILSDPHCSWAGGTPASSSTARSDFSCPWASLTTAPGIRCPPLHPSAGLLAYGALQSAQPLCSLLGRQLGRRQRKGLYCAALRHGKKGEGLSIVLGNRLCLPRRSCPGGVCWGQWGLWKGGGVGRRGGARGHKLADQPGSN